MEDDEQKKKKKERAIQRRATILREIEDMHKFHKQIKLDKMFVEMNQKFQARINKVKKEIGPLIGEQHEVITDWWKQMAIQFDKNIHHTFINDIPEEIVTSFLIQKDVVQNKEKAMQLYKVTHVNMQGHNFIKSISKNDFMKMFCRYMFVDALIKVTHEIDQTGSVNIKTGENLSQEIPLVLKINQFERQ